MYGQYDDEEEISTHTFVIAGRRRVANEFFDASIGLAFSLNLFENYKKNGVLQAKIHHVPGVRGHCQAFIQLVEGKPTSSYVEDAGSKRIALPIDVLVRVDNERGPFEWYLTPHPPSSPSQTTMPLPSTQQSPIPHVVAPLDLEMLQGWSNEHKMMLTVVYEAINGQHSVDTLKQTISLPTNIIEEALRILLKLKCIVIIQ